ncbi:lipid transferase CIDEC-like isoform 3-T3 [Synchiropus picturatus]
MSAANKTQQILSARVARSKPFRVSNAERSVKKGITADSLDDLMNKVKDSLDLISVAALVLDEDGTDVDNEEFFRTLPDNCVLVVLEEGQKWTQQTSTLSRDQLIKCHSEQRTDVAKLTFDFYKNDPRDFIGCLNVKATLYGAYSLSYDLRCHAAKKGGAQVDDPLHAGYWSHPPLLFLLHRAAAGRGERLEESLTATGKQNPAAPEPAAGSYFSIEKLAE